MDAAERERLLDAVIDRDAIRQVIAAYPRASDRVDRELLLSLYHHDAIDHHGAFEGTAADLAEVLGAKTDAKVMHHMVGQSMIELAGDTAFAETYTIYNAIMEPVDGAGGPRWVMTGGRYIDRLERRDGEWKIAERTATIDLSQQVTAPPPYARADSFERAAPFPDDVVYRRP